MEIPRAREVEEEEIREMQEMYGKAMRYCELVLGSNRAI